MKKITKLPSIKEHKVFFLVIFLIILAFYLFVNFYFHEQSFYSEKKLQLGAQVITAGMDNIPLLESTNWTRAPLSFLNYLISPRHPAIPSIFLGAFMIAYAILFVVKNFYTKLIMVVLSLVLVFSPSVIFTITQSPEFTILIFLFSFSIYFLLEFTVDEQVYYLFIAAMLLGLVFYAKFEFIWVSLFIALLFFVLYARRGRFLNYLIAILFPLIFFLVSYLFLIWIFGGNMEGFIKKVFVFDFGQNVNCALDCFFKSFSARWPYFLLYLYVLIKVAHFRPFFHSPLFLTFVSPFLVSLTLSFFGIAFLTSYFAVFCLLIIIVLFPYLGPLFNELRQRFVLTGFFVFIIVFEFMTFGIARGTEERHFMQALNPVHHNVSVEEYKEAASVIEECDAIFAVGQNAYGIIFFYDGQGRFITPDSPVYTAVRTNPVYFLDAVVVKKDSGENALKALSSDGEPPEGFEPVFESERFVVFRIAEVVE